MGRARTTRRSRVWRNMGCVCLQLIDWAPGRGRIILWAINSAPARMSHHDKYGIATAEPVSYSHTMNVPAYLARIGYSGPVTPTAEVLRALHRAHMLSVPFENLD